MPKFKIRILAGKHQEKEFLFNPDGSPMVDQFGTQRYVLHTYSASPKDPREGHTFVSNHNLAAIFNQPPGCIKFELLGIIDDEPKPVHKPAPAPQKSESTRQLEPGFKEDPTRQPASHQPKQEAKK